MPVCVVLKISVCYHHCEDVLSSCHSFKGLFQVLGFRLESGYDGTVSIAIFGVCGAQLTSVVVIKESADYFHD